MCWLDFFSWFIAILIFIILIPIYLVPEFVDDPKKLLQLLYDSNVITAIETDENNKKFFIFRIEKKIMQISILKF